MRHGLFQPPLFQPPLFQPRLRRLSCLSYSLVERTAPLSRPLVTGPWWPETPKTPQSPQPLTAAPCTGRGHPPRPDQSTPLRAGLLSLAIYDGELQGADAARLCLEEAAVAVATPVSVATPIAASWDAWGGVPVVTGVPLVT